MDYLKKKKAYERLEDTLSRASMSEEEAGRRDVPTTEDVLDTHVLWDALCKAELIGEIELELIQAYDKRDLAGKLDVLAEDGQRYARLFLDLLTNLSQIDYVQYTLALVDEILTEDKELSSLFLSLKKEGQGFPFSPFLRLLNRSASDAFINEKASRLVALLMAESSEVPDTEVKFFCHWCSEQLRSESLYDLLVAISALQILLRKPAYRPYFAKENGLRRLATVVQNHLDKRQLLYQAIYCLWLMSFDAEIATTFSSVPQLIPTLVDVIRKEETEKIRRIGLATLRNILDKAQNNEQMIEAGMMRVVHYLDSKKWADEDIEEDIKELEVSLEKNVILLTSFDIYKQEILSGNLRWSPVHRSEKFWRENIARFEEDSFKIVGVLLQIVRSSEDRSVVCIALHDLGEFVRFHPRGRAVLSRLDGKVDIMKLMSNSDSEIQKHALMCVQKMMVNNWEFLSRGTV